jgi:hypothetical protein
VADAPFLLDGEAVAFSAKPAFSLFHWIGVIILTFIPPFLWGPGLFLMLRYQKKHSGVWVTNNRLVHFEKVPFSGSYRITSIPLDQITRIKKGSLAGGPSDLLLDLLNRLVGIADVKVFVKDSACVQHSMTNIKPAGALIKYVESVIKPTVT